MMSKHTPGPWKVEGDSVYYIDGIEADAINLICRCGDPSNERFAADAHLIVAAPDLLEACKGALKWLEGIKLQGSEARDYMSDGQPSDFGLNKLRAAIRKAEEV